MTRWERLAAEAHQNPRTGEILSEADAVPAKINNPYSVTAYDFYRKLKTVQVGLQVTHLVPKPLRRRALAWLRRDTREPATFFNLQLSADFAKVPDAFGKEKTSFPFSTRAFLGPDGFRMDHHQQEAFYLPRMRLKTHPISERTRTPFSAFMRHILLYGMHFRELERQIGLGEENTGLPDFRKTYATYAQNAIESGPFSLHEKEQLRAWLKKKIG